MTDKDVHTSLASRDSLLADAASRARRYLSQVGDRAVAPSAEALDALHALEMELPASGIDAREVLALLDDTGSPATVATTGPRYFGFVIGGALPVAVAASWILAAWDQNAALAVMSPIAARLEQVALDWTIDLLDLPAGTGGAFVSGASMANTTCLAAARDAVLRGVGWDAGALGLVGAPPITVVVGAEAHTTVHKALGLVGLGRDRAVRLPVDAEGRIRPDGLPELEAPSIVCLQAGNVNSGASDPFVPLVAWARAQGAWVHVDGAFGLWAAASPDLASQVSGVADADSWATDAHKWLNTTYDCGIALVRDEDALARAMRADAAYLPATGGQRDPMHFSPQSSQRARAVEVWAVIASLGRDGLAELVAGSVRLARRFADGARAGGFEVLNDVVLNQVLLAAGDDATTEAVIARVQRDGTLWCGPTRWRGRAAIRVSISCWATTAEDVDASVDAMVAALGR